MIVCRLDEGLKRRLSIRAAQSGRSTEDEVRDILQTALRHDPEAPEKLLVSVRSRFAPLSGVDLDLPPRSPLREPPLLD